MRHRVSTSTGRPASTSASPHRARCATLPRRVTTIEPARQLTLLDIPGEVSVDPLERARVEPDFLRVRVHLQLHRRGGIIDSRQRDVNASAHRPRPDQRKTIGIDVDRNTRWTQRADNSLTSQEVTMAVRKSINIAGSGPTIEASIHEAIDRAYTT